MAETAPATSREAILLFHYADRMKSELLIASALLNVVITMKEAELVAGRRVLAEYFRALEREVAVGQSFIQDPEMVRVRTVMTGLTGMVDAGPLNEVQQHLTWVVSHMTTYAQRAMQYLLDQGLL